MKKLFVICFLCLVVLCGCSHLKFYNMAVNNLAEVRYNLYSGKTENVSATFMSGRREADYVVNGFCTKPKEFGVLTFKIDSKITLPKTVNFVLTVGTTRHDGVLEKNPFDGSFLFDLKTIIDGVEVINAKVIAGEFVEEVELMLVTKNFNVNWDNALRIACKELEGALGEFVVDGEFKGEVYVKLICDEDILETYYWYVSFVSRTGKNYSVIINPQTNEIMGKKSI